ncbi:MAG TPA: hypothetical protein VMM92_04870 [Thermoanaerobaculia bacterium]|nr:hypothetical protein [Thermoanaerobaculia bacterium]
MIPQARGERVLPLLLFGLLLLPVPVRPQAAPGESRTLIEAEIRLERRLLARDITAYTQARAAEQRERGRYDVAASRLDQLVTGGNLTIAGFENLENEVRNAAESARAASDRVGELRERASERLRRIGALQEELAGRPANRDPLSGRWRVRLGPGDRAGTFDLRLRGTLVSGTFSLDDGPSGSLTGTFVDGTLTLHRVDSRAGFDVTYVGGLDAAAGRISGSWQGTELANGNPTSGGWTAARQPAEEP